VRVLARAVAARAGTGSALDGGPVGAGPAVAPGIEPRILERREEVARQRTRRRWRVALVVGVVVVVAAGTWAALHSPVLAARHVSVVGAVHTNPAAIVAAVDLQGQPLVDVNPGRVAARVEALPWVAHATVARHWPSGVTVTVTERTPAAVIAGPGPAASVIDAGGRVLTTAAAQPGTVVLVAPVTPGRPGSTLRAAAGPGLAALAAAPASLAGRLQHVIVAADGDVSLGLAGDVSVTMGPAVELPAKFEALVSVLADVPPTGAENIDVTVPDAPAVGPPLPTQPVVPAVEAPRTATTGHASTAPQVRQGGR
ncbi:MAG: cell division protein FtsQ/DivIB, partial [Acidimicrobiales bacterium]